MSALHRLTLACSFLFSVSFTSSGFAADWPQMQQALNPLIAIAEASSVRMSVGVIDLRDSAGADPREVLLGSGESYPPASTVKMLLISALMQQVDAGSKSLSDTTVVEPGDIVGGMGIIQNGPVPQTVTLERLAELMITISDNTATNVLVDEVGYDAMRNLVDQLGMEDMQFARKMFGTPNPPEVENYITAKDSITLLRALYAGEFLSPASRQQILDWMSAQTVKTKIGAGVPIDVPVAHKTGENGPVSHDIGYILIPGQEVAVAIFTQSGTTNDFDEAQAQLNPLVAEVAATIVQVLREEEADSSLSKTR